MTTDNWTIGIINSRQLTSDIATNNENNFQRKSEPQ